jgi:signal transduction histidine kinase
MAPALEAVAVSAGAAVLVGAVGAVVVHVLARRWVTAAVLVTPLVVVACVAAGVLVGAKAMFLSAHDTGVVLLVLLAAVPVGLVVGAALVGTVRALDRRAVEAAAALERDRAVEASRRELVSWVSHDLRTPLAGVRAMAEALQDGVAADSGRYHARILLEADRLSAMIDDLLELSRIQAGQLGLALVEVDLGDVVSDTLAGTQALAGARGVRLAGAVHGPVSARVDVAATTRALTNLVVNAIRHTPPDGSVTVEADRDGASAVLRVTDQCGGIAPTDLARVFEPGFRGSSARTPAGGEGAGLGLAIVRGLAEAHGGAVRVRNALGGCSFELLLPAT